MGLTKQYLRYVPAGKFNIIASSNCNVVFVTLHGQEGRYVAVGACEDIIVWDLRLGEKALVLPGDKHEVTYLTESPTRRYLAAGYSDGTVKVFDLKSGDNVTVFSGHRAAISCLTYDSEGHRLASGAKDTDIIIWDVVAEAGLHRLSGHKGVVTQVRFLAEHNVLVSSSKDTFVKFWDLDTVHCFKTLVGHRAEVWGFTLVKDDKYLVTGCADNELRVWKLIYTDTDNSENIEKTSSEVDSANSDNKSQIQCEKAGSILRSGRGRVVTLSCDATSQIVVCHGAENSVELFYFRGDSDAQDKLKKRLRKERKKSLKEGEKPAEPQPLDAPPGLKDEVLRLPVIKTDGKLKSAHVIMGRGEEIRVAVALNNNAIELHTIERAVKDAECRCLRKISSQGHHSEVRTLCFSSDSLAIASASADSLKMWNRPSQVCLRTVETGYALSTCFVPGDRHVLVGLKSGHLLIVDIAAGDVLETIPAHNQELWAISITPDQRGCVTGGGDKTVKFWQFELISDPNSESKAKVLSLLHKRTLKLEESVLAVKITPNGNLLAVSLLDATVKVFFVDTLKFFLSLYGHKLPVLCLDVSYDSTLIATGSADRNVKIWGLDFGDCHRSLFAHDDSVMALQFVPRTHQFFTCGKDGRVKQWDADTYDKILTLQAHHGEAWALAVSPNGQYVVSSGSDRVLRLFERSEEPLVLEDEAEEEREAEDNAALVTGDATVVPGHIGLNLPSRKTVGSENAAEQLIECLQVGKEYSLKLLEHEELHKNQKVPPPPAPAIMQAYQATTPEDYLLEVLSRIRSSDLEEALLILPFTTVCELLTMLPSLLKRGSHTEIVTRVMMFLVRIHHGPIVSNQALLPVITKLHKVALRKVNDLRDIVGYNLHGLKFLQHELEVKEGVQLFREATLQKRDRDRRKKRKAQVAKSAIIMLH
ncbi:WD repeat-containing protein 3 [Anabrus simplex]|uniref:WD repeat-containing protein 3 n=1 Tax=Anabrus simplex TaxID=316456 RepID=UPI0035A2A3D9